MRPRRRPCKRHRDRNPTTAWLTNNRQTAGRISLAAKDSATSGILLFAKESGPTSFSSLSVIKRALGTGKVGHTGTLDSFAEGLLVVLVGKMTRLVPYITAADKKYSAVVAFGAETDTLESSGIVIKEAPAPTRQQIESVLSQFRGRISQVPPRYSAVHVEGRRASDLVRSGTGVDLPPREITIHSLELVDYDGRYGLIDVICSKGTYIRSLARDIAAAAGSCGHLVALRRTAVGPFRLEDAVFAEKLEPFTLASRGFSQVDIDEKISAPQAGKPWRTTAAELEAVAGGLVQFTPAMAASCGLSPLVLDSSYLGDFFQGRPPRSDWFRFWLDSSTDGRPSADGFSSEAVSAARNSTSDDFLSEAVSADFPVFLESGDLAGMVKPAGNRFHYGFVIPQTPEHFSEVGHRSERT